MAHLPRIVYRYLPDLYVLGGIYVVLRIDNLIGMLSGLLLVATGLLVFHFRLEHRDP